MGDLTRVLKEDTALAGTLKDVAAALEQGLLYLHDSQVLIVDKGKTVFRSAMTIRLIPEEAKRRFVQSDFEPLYELDKKYAQLGLADVDLGFAGRKSANDPVHRAIKALQVGDPLFVVDAGGRLEMRNGQGITAGRLAQKFRLPIGTIESVTVSAIAHRSKRQVQDAGWAKTCKIDGWEVVLCSICLAGRGKTGSVTTGVSLAGKG